MGSAGAKTPSVTNAAMQKNFNCVFINELLTETHRWPDLVLKHFLTLYLTRKDIPIVKSCYIFITTTVSIKALFSNSL